MFKNLYIGLTKFRRIYTYSLFTVLLSLILFGGTAGAITLSGNINSHDPAGLQKDSGRYFHFTTGTNIWYSYSDNLTTWTPGPSTVFSSPPSWVYNYVSGFGGSFWAPDLIYMNGAYY